jgi:hypothetical protein
VTRRAGSDDARYGTIVEDGRVYVGTEAGRIEVGGVETVLDLVGGPAWMIAYTERQKRRYPDLDTSDEGLTVDVVDVMNAMTHDSAFVETLQAQASTDPTGDVPPRMGLFVGRLLSNLQYGID